MAEHDDDIALLRRWFRRLQVCVQTVDLVASRARFAEDLITLDTYAPCTVWREAAATE